MIVPASVTDGMINTTTTKAFFSFNPAEGIVDFYQVDFVNADMQNFSYQVRNLNANSSELKITSNSIF